MLQGLMYGVGPVAESVGIEVELTGDLEGGTYEELVETTVDDFLNEYPSEIDSALSLVRSRNPIEVEKGLQNIGEIGIEYAEQRLPRPVMDTSQQRWCGAAVVCVAYFVAAAHNTVAVTALAAVVAGGAVYLGKWTWGPARNSMSAATREALIVDIIDGLEGVQ
ncbi:hypothetical protein [Actinomyces lilanjuaniae]|uniref:hypothetical protein n=1 Tax=Actinomyces lilanjuaniae TaxID=2321394 RepID=UPI0013C44B19|nr:hypothetical protein [Actinomyces lilanjuaniae]